MTSSKPSISTVTFDLLDAAGGAAILLEDTRMCGMSGGGTVLMSWRVETSRILAAIGETKLQVGYEFAIAAGRLPRRLATEVGLQALGIEGGELRVKLNLNEREGFISLSRGFVHEMLSMWPPPEPRPGSLVIEVTAGAGGLQVETSRTPDESLDERLERERDTRHALLCSTLDVIVLGHAMSRDDWERACELTGRYCEPYLSREPTGEPSPPDDDSDLVDEDPSWECPSCGETWSAREHAKWRDRFSENCVDAITCPMCEDEEDDDAEPT
jgi:hypothetical protein